MVDAKQKVMPVGRRKMARSSVEWVREGNEAWLVYKKPCGGECIVRYTEDDVQQIVSMWKPCRPCQEICIQFRYHHIAQRHVRKSSSCMITMYLMPER